MKTINLIIFLFFVQIVNAQENKFYNCNYCGYYVGKSDSLDGSETNHIYVKLFLLQDSTYSYEIGGVFPRCTSRTFIGTGKWFADTDWLYFKPDTSENGVALFVMGSPVPSDKQNKDETTKYYKHNNDGYHYALKLTRDNSSCDKIFFRIAWDCFKRDWPNNSIQKTNCK